MPNSDTLSHSAPQGYRLWKDEHCRVSEPKRRTGQLLSNNNLYGRTKIDSREVTHIYGTHAPDAAMFGGTVTDADKKVADVQNAYFAHTRQSKKKIVRPFYQLLGEDGQNIAEMCQENLNDLIRETNGKSGY
jgi:phage gpG-like protein